MTRLAALHPRWTTLPQWASPSQFSIGLSFLCPHCEVGPCPRCGRDRSNRLGFNFWPPIDPDRLHGRSFDELPECYRSGPGIFQRVSGDSFDTLTIAGEVFVPDHADGFPFEIQDGQFITHGVQLADWTWRRPRK